MPRVKSSQLAVFLALFLILSPALAAQFWGSTKSNKYHYPSCRMAKKIKPEHKIVFPSVQEARQKGYQPCGVCKPSITGKARKNGFGEKPPVPPGSVSDTLPTNHSSLTIGRTLE